MKLFKKLSTYFFTAVFFAGFYPQECDWPYPGSDGPGLAQENIQQHIMNTPANELEIA